MTHELLSTLKISPTNDLGARTALFISESSFLLGQHLFVRRDGHYRAKGPWLPNRQVCYDSVIEMHVCPGERLPHVPRIIVELCGGSLYAEAVEVQEIHFVRPSITRL